MKSSFCELLVAGEFAPFYGFDFSLEIGQTFSGFSTKIQNIKFQHLISTGDGVSCNSFPVSSVVSGDNAEH